MNNIYLIEYLVFSLFPKDKNLLIMRILYTIVFLLLTTSIYGQKSTLLQNINVRAKELKHSLNKTGDSLILEGERTIYKVEIFNKVIQTLSGHFELVNMSEYSKNLNGNMKMNSI